MNEDIKIAKNVIDTEIKGLQSLKQIFDDSFLKAVETILNCSGRVIVTGMGKSGHIANKIAATLSSTGTPAFFIHPAEASHGDLGMITELDTVLALSNSGETRELSDIVAFTRRFKIPLISITQNEKSSLSKSADISIVLSKEEEACPNGLAPTTSSTMMLVFGDALAVTLLKKKGFSKHDFKLFHPGGKLGAKLMHVKDLMHTGDRVPLVNSGTRMSDALLEMTKKRFGCVGVLDAKNKLIGIVTDGDLRRSMTSDLLQKSVDDVMSKNPKTIDKESLVESAVSKMSGTITTLFIVDGNNKVAGILSIHDCLLIGAV
jgi:arabinose-5-phosphate isomerase